MPSHDRTDTAPTDVEAARQGIDVSRHSPAIDLVAYVDAYIDGTSSTGSPRNALFDYIDTLTDTQRADVRADMVAEVARLLDGERRDTKSIRRLGRGRRRPRPSQADRTENSLAERVADDVMTLSMLPKIGH